MTVIVQLLVTDTTVSQFVTDNISTGCNGYCFIFSSTVCNGYYNLYTSQRFVTDTITVIGWFVTDITMVNFPGVSSSINCLPQGVIFYFQLNECLCCVCGSPLSSRGACDPCTAG